MCLASNLLHNICVWPLIYYTTAPNFCGQLLARTTTIYAYKGHVYIVEYMHIVVYIVVSFFFLVPLFYCLLLFFLTKKKWQLQKSRAFTFAAKKFAKRGVPRPPLHGAGFFFAAKKICEFFFVERSPSTQAPMEQFFFSWRGKRSHKFAK